MGLWWMGWHLFCSTLFEIPNAAAFDHNCRFPTWVQFVGSKKRICPKKSQPKNQWLFGDACRGRGQNTNSNWPRCCITMTHGAASSHTIDLQFKAAKSNPNFKASTEPLKTRVLRTWYMRQVYIQGSAWKSTKFHRNQFFFQSATPMNDATRFYIWKFPTESASNKPICWAVKNNSWPCWCWRWTWHP